MKSSLSVHVGLRAVFSFLALALFASFANAEDAASRIKKIAAVNSLDLPGKTPFHLKMSFQLYDLDGKPSDTGILEEWWAAPGKSRTTIIAASLKQSEPMLLDDSKRTDPRELYLVRELLRNETRPLPDGVPQSTATLNEANRKFGKTTVRCLDMPPLQAEFRPDQAGINFPAKVCLDPGTDTLLLQFSNEEGHIVGRRDLGTFHETAVPLELQISYANKLAIIGKVIQIQTFDPLGTQIEFPTPDAEFEGPPGRQHVFTPPQPLSTSNSNFESEFMRYKTGGVVVLNGLVSKEGKIKDVFIIASSNAFWASAALADMCKFKFKPFLMNGQPVEERMMFVMGVVAGGAQIEISGPHSVPSPH